MALHCRISLVTESQGSSQQALWDQAGTEGTHSGWNGIGDRGVPSEGHLEMVGEWSRCPTVWSHCAAAQQILVSPWFPDSLAFHDSASGISVLSVICANQEGFTDVRTHAQWEASLLPYMHPDIRAVSVLTARRYGLK
jgi:hypothetical protein